MTCIAGANAYFQSFGIARMKIKVVVHEAEEGGFWAEVPTVSGRAIEGETMNELLRNLHQAVEGCLSVDIAEVPQWR
jgi:predicted RNase H-like HicB family nuclease